MTDIMHQDFFKSQSQNKQKSQKHDVVRQRN